jgi:hypothetical protein
MGGPMVNIDELTPHDLCAGLMRGDRVDMKRGYNFRAAAMAAAERKGLTEEETDELVAFARGFAIGMRQAMHEADPAMPEPPEELELDYEDRRQRRAYKVGQALGETEDGFRLYPE